MRQFRWLLLLPLVTALALAGYIVVSTPPTAGIAEPLPPSHSPIPTRTATPTPTVLPTPTPSPTPTKPPEPVTPPKPAKPKPAETGLDARCLEGRVLCADQTQKKLWWVVDGEVKMRLDVRFGSKSHPTYDGVFKVNSKQANAYSYTYNARMPYSMFFDYGRAIHFSDAFVAQGYRGYSHGCINVRDLKPLQQLFSEVNVGDRVIVYHS